MKRRFSSRQLFEFLRLRRTTIFCVVFVGMIAAFYLTALRTSVVATQMENLALSGRFQFRGMIDPDPRIGIIGVDTSSMKVQERLDAQDYEAEPAFEYMVPQWPWDKRVFARVLEKLGEAGAKMVIFDFVFFSQSEGDWDFSDVIKEYRGQTVLASYYQLQETADGGYAVVFYEPYDDVLPDPLDEHDNYDDLIGYANVLTDADKQVRRVYYHESSILLNLKANPGAELPPQALDIESDLFAMSAVAAKKIDPDVVLPSRDQDVLLNYTGPANTYRMIPVEEILFPTRWENLFQNGEVFKDKIIVVGPYAEAQFKDIHPTPYGTMPGPEIQANLVVSLLRNNFIYPLSKGWSMGLTLLYGTIALTIFLRYQSALRKVMGLCIAIALYLVISQVAFESARVLMPVNGFLLCFFVGGNFALLYDFILEQYDRMRIHGMFGTYVSPEVVNNMIASGEEPQLGGVEEHITCFFSDVQSFSSFSEVLTPVQLVDLMNEYLTAMTDILQEQGGTLDKYIGDAIVAMFGAPIRMDEHAYKACVATCLMQRRQAELREKWASEGTKWPDLCHRMQTRIGLNTGHATVGNMGSKARFNYTFMGDNVNLAARCESGAKSYGVYNMITDATYREAQQYGNDLVFRYLDKIIVKGRKQPVSVYELVGLKEDINDAHRSTLELWDQGIEQYLKREWHQAIQFFTRALDYEPHHPDRCPDSPTTPSHVLIDRCRLYQETPPPDDWDGVFIMRTK